MRGTLWQLHPLKEPVPSIKNACGKQKTSNLNLFLLACTVSSSWYLVSVLHKYYGLRKVYILTKKNSAESHAV